MSGICGVVSFGAMPDADSIVRKMMDAARHRGPNGNNCVVGECFGIGYLSLEVTPESVGEIQPLVHEPSGLIVVGDLRLDNRAELLAALGETVAEVLRTERTPTDAELVLAACLKWPKSHAERMLGDFAYAVCNPKKRTIELTRDPMGLRALYFRMEADRLLFATEVKQLLAAPGIEMRLDERAVACHLSGLYPDMDTTFFHGIEQIVPGETVTFRAGSANRRRFWDIDVETSAKRGKEADLFAEFRQIFLEAVRCRLRSTKTVGLSLSGGLDSGSIASAAGWMAEHGQSARSQSFRAYSWAFDELSSCDERSTSRQVAGRYRIPVTDVPADQAWPLASIDRNRPDIDDPYITYYHDLVDQVLAVARKDGVGLMFTGERGDAVTDHWVYDYPGLLASGRIMVLLAELSAHGREMGLSLPGMAKRSLWRPLLATLRSRTNTGDKTGGRRRYPAYIRSAFAARSGLDGLLGRSPAVAGFGNQARRLRHELVFSSMCVRRITLKERHQAAHGIGYADPWSDRRVAEYVISLPQHIVHRYLDFKRLTRASLGDILPECLRQFSHSAAKANPTPLYNRGIFDRSRDTVRELLSNSRAAGYGFVDERVLRDNYEDALRGRPEPYELWWFLTLEMWLREYW